jgi:hypothetical protein
MKMRKGEKVKMGKGCEQPDSNIQLIENMTALCRGAATGIEKTPIEKPCIFRYFRHFPYDFLKKNQVMD